MKAYWSSIIGIKEFSRQQSIEGRQRWGHMKNTRRNTCTGARYAMLVRVNCLINFDKTKTNTNPNPNPDPNRYRRHCPDPNARIQKSEDLQIKWKIQN